MATAGMNAPTPLAPGRPSFHLKSALSLIAALLVTAAVLGYAVNLSSPYQMDQGSKAAKIVYMVQHNTFFQPLAGPDFYRVKYFSLYYILSAISYAFTGGSIFGSMNVTAAIAGIIFFFSIFVALKRVYQIRYFDSCVVFLSMPVLVTTFTYGNEIAFAMAFFGASLVVLVSPWRWRYILGGGLYALSLFCRPDSVFLAPFVAGWTYLYGAQARCMWPGATKAVNSVNSDDRAVASNRLNSPKSASTTDPRPRERLQATATTALSCCVVAVAYWAVFIRTAGIGETAFEWGTNLKLLAAFLTYPFCPSVVILGVVSLCILPFNRRKDVLLYLLLLVPLAYYIRMLSSPNLVIGLSLFFGVPALIALSRVTKPLLRWAITASILFWWVVSVSPYGISGPTAGSYWFIPSAHGSLPTGAYLGFYAKARQGFYQEMYDGEIASCDRLADYLIHTKAGVFVFGRFNYHFLSLSLVERGQFERVRAAVKLDTVDLSKNTDDRPVVMVQRGYLCVDRMTQSSRQQLTQWLQAGQIKALDDFAGPFPELIEVGQSVAAGTNLELGGRILFMQNQFGGHGAAPSKYFLDAFKPICWLPKKQAAEMDLIAIYADSQFCALTSPIPGGKIWRLYLPSPYLRERNPVF
jgi:type IV secretory pathway VirB2 component (pilin)